jgi:hypothetical protein
MKPSMKVRLVTLLALLSLASLGAGNAQASQPEYEGAPATFTGAQIGSSEMTAFATITCSSGAVSGEVNTATTLKSVIFVFSGCKEPIFGTPCTSAGSGTGSIKSNTLKGNTAYLKGASQEAGIVFKPQSGTTAASFSCTISGSHVVSGELICHAAPVNTLSVTGEFNCTKSGSTQTPTSYLNPSGCSTITGVSLDDDGSAAALAAEFRITYSKALKLKSSQCV